MSQPTVDNPSNRFATAVIPLLKEYTQKLDAMAQQAREIQGKHDKYDRDSSAQKSRGLRAEYVDQIMQGLQAQYSVLEQRYQRLLPAAHRLAQTVSQRIEHADLDDSTRLELALRLAEFESAITSTEMMMRVARF